MRVRGPLPPIPFVAMLPTDHLPWPAQRRPGPGTAARLGTYDAAGIQAIYAGSCKPLRGAARCVRDVQTSCGILLDDNNQKPLCRLYFNTSQHAIGLFDNSDSKETRVPLASLDELYCHAERLKTTLGNYVK